MKVYITGTPEVSNDLINEVCEELNKVKGILSFIPSSKLNQFELNKLNVLFDQLENQSTLSFDMFFSLCQANRVVKKINDDDYFVILSSIRNDLDWFSATKNKNTFIDTNDWGQYTNNNPVCGIAYQVIENIFQSLIGIYYDNAETHPNVHFENEGCINDFCDDKKSIRLKLRTADICKSCQQKALDSNVQLELITQIIRILENIHLGVKNLKLNENIKLELIEVTNRGEVVIGSKSIHMKSLPKTLFITFLKEHEPISKTSLESRKRQILEIYQILKGSDEGAIERLVDPNGKTFRQSKWEVNNVLSNELDETIVSEYIIDEVQKNKYLIRISPEFRKLDL